MKSDIYFALTLILIIFLSACVKTSNVPSAKSIILCNKKDLITIENYRVSKKIVNEGENTSIYFSLTNNCAFEINNINLIIFDPSAFGSNDYSISCGNKKGKHISIDLKRYDIIDCNISLTSPSQIDTSIPARVGFYLKYNLSSNKVITIPVIDGKTVKIPPSKYSESEIKYGYLDFKVNPPIGNIREEDGKVIKEYWGVNNEPFVVEFFLRPMFSGIGSFMNIELNNLQIKLEDNKLEVNDKNCDFEKANNYIIKSDVLRLLREAGTNDWKDFKIVCEFIYNSNSPISYPKIELVADYNVTIYFFEDFVIKKK